MRSVARGVRRSALLLVPTILLGMALPAVSASAEPRDERRSTVGARGGATPRHDIVIDKDSEFDRRHGVRSGSGTESDPYVISGWEVHNLIIRNTDSYVSIFDNRVRGTMVLDWVGDRVHVHHNDARDLRINQNVKRTGEATSGHIVSNRFGFVGQLRHWDGVFSGNVVGSKDRSTTWDDLWPFWRHRAVNFDGFNGAQFTDNVIYGYMDARLHGHHHSSSFGDNSHYHGADHEAHPEMVDHSERYHQVAITGNKIYSDYYYALAYLDTAHSVNDRTAASETDKNLNKPHVHHTRVDMSGNELFGGGIAVRVFNARDDRHEGTAPGSVDIRNNRITLAPENDTDVFMPPHHGISVQDARDLELSIIGNTIIGPEQESTLSYPTDEWWFGGEPAGIYLRGVDKGRVYLLDNFVSHRPYGIRASSFTHSVRWWIGGFKVTDVDKRVYYDQSVKRRPEQGP